MRTAKHFPFHGHTMTKYVEIDRRRCQACWKCVETCPNHVLGKAILFRHRHAHVDYAKGCKGCKKCVDNCPNNAIRYTHLPPNRKLRSDHDSLVIARMDLEL